MPLLFESDPYEIESVPICKNIIDIKALKKQILILPKKSAVSIKNRFFYEYEKNENKKMLIC